MKKSHINILFILCLFTSHFVNGQQKEPGQEISMDSEQWTAINRNVDHIIYLNAQPGDGVYKHKAINFKNGRIELDIKGKDITGKSFVGIAFHGLNDSTYEAVYFRPFNFMDTERNAVQYISHPKNPWYKLREEHPGKYETPFLPEVDPNDWFHVAIVVEHPSIKVFVNGSKEPVLAVTSLSAQKQGFIGFYVGNNSDGYFKNLRIVKQE